MATYVIGDVQGCMRSLEALLGAIGFREETDRLWFVGDLVNRGPDSLAVLRYCYDRQDHIQTVLGNHDLHLLACWLGVREPRSNDTLDDVLSAPDRDELLHWLVAQPLTHAESGVLMVHAGVHPAWSLDDVLQRSAQAGALLQETHEQSRAFRVLFERDATIVKEYPDTLVRLKETVDVLTRMRMLDEHMRLDFQFAGEPKDAPMHLKPWFVFPSELAENIRVVFGHWSALGVYRSGRWVGLDSGCVWGGQLSAYCIEDNRFVQVDSELKGRVHTGREG